jgi:small neutral amino acid transporter SnatA (MarC family)
MNNNKLHPLLKAVILATQIIAFLIFMVNSFVAELAGNDFASILKTALALFFLMVSIYMISKYNEL